MAYLLDRQSLKTEVGNKQKAWTYNSLIPLEIIAAQKPAWAHPTMPVDLHESKRQNEHMSIPLFVHKVMHILFIFSEA